jgi:hypothetical protein
MNHTNYVGRCTEDETVQLLIECIHALPLHRVCEALRTALDASEKDEVAAQMEADS